MWEKTKKREWDMVISELNNCARCGDNHKSICFYKFDNPVNDFTYWTMCPATNEPILLKIEEDE